VGKNLLVERLVEQLEGLWGLEVPLLLIEGPSYTYPSDINELRGSTRGFIRSDEEGLLTEFHHRASAAPFSVILVDEVEKAHAQLRKYFLSIMDRGTTIDNRGQELNFSSTLLVYTSNLGYSDLQQSSDPIGFGDQDARANYERATLLGDLKKELSPEFINRTRILHFKSLTERSIQKIFELELDKIAQRYRRVHGLELTVTDDARAALISQGFSPEYGARHLGRVLNQVCNVGVSKKLRHDSVREKKDQESRGLLAYIQEARKEERITDLDMLHRKVMERTRAKVAYMQVVVDFANGSFHYNAR
jgi:ATP-dependent Clp protease ATP-binding subunit ClpA